MAEGMAGAAKQGGGRMTVFGIITIVMGVLAMMSPMVAGASVAIFVGILLLIGGVARMIWAFQADSLGQGVLKFAIGGLTLLCGLMMVGRPLFATLALTLLLAAYFFVDGLFEIIGAFQAKPASGWGWLLFGGIVSLALGMMIWRQFPLSGTWAIGILIGIKLFFAGLMMITVGSTVRAIGSEAEAMMAEQPTAPPTEPVVPTSPPPAASPAESAPEAEVDSDYDGE